MVPLVKKNGHGNLNRRSNASMETTDEGSGGSQDERERYLNKAPNSELFPTKFKLFSEVHIFSSARYAKHEAVQIGDICPDEILDIEMDVVKPASINESASNVNVSVEES